MQTLIELYDDRPLENVLATQMFLPKRTVFLCSREVFTSSLKQQAIRRYLEGKGCTGEITYVQADMYSAGDVERALEAVIESCGECVMDITGGTDAALFACGAINARKGTPAFTYSRKANCFYSIHEAPFGAQKPCELKLSVEDGFIMAGGAVKQGRVDNAVLGKYLGFFKPFFDVFLRFKREWISIVTYMQRASAPVNGEISCEVDAPYSVKGDRGMVQCNEQALEALRRMGFIRQLSIESGRRVQFRFRDLQVRAWLRDIGSVLETYVYKTCLDARVFDDVATSVVVDWEGDLKQSNVTNELDVMATKGVVPFFISCKTGEIKTEAINELAVLRDRFGSGLARAAIVSASKCQHINRHRANELDISVIDIEDLKCGHLEERLKALAR